MKKATQCQRIRLQLDLDYPGIGPEHSYLKESGRAEYYTVTNEEALEAFQKLSKTEGIIPALESAHAIAYTIKLAPTLSKDDIIIVNLSGRGDKDVQQVFEMFQGQGKLESSLAFFIHCKMSKILLF